MKTALGIGLKPSIALTPHLQQAIRLLSLSSIELEQEIQQKIESNPLLEILENAHVIENDAEPKKREEEEDIQWSSLYTKQNIDTSRDDLTERIPNQINLQDYLRWQLNLTSLTEEERLIAWVIIDSIDENGLLKASLKDLKETLAKNQYLFTEADIERVRHQILQFDPMGCGAMDLKEVLLTQLHQLPSSHPFLKLTKQLVTENLDLLAKHDYKKLMNIYQVNDHILDEMLTTIKKLNPHPGRALKPREPISIIPDLIVHKQTKGWSVETNPNLFPRITINQHYMNFLNSTPKNKSEHSFLKKYLYEARWFLKSIKTRQETLLKVARYIIQYQTDFLKFGELSMHPLVLKEVADALNLHESTVSRVTTEKYIYTPRGLYKLKDFFSGKRSQKSKPSPTAIRAFLKKVIASENSARPLSDNDIVKLMKAHGIIVARRTISKYREMLKISAAISRRFTR